MSDNESITAMPPHPTLGGKSLEAFANQRPYYNSWRKKYRKIRYEFDQILEENKRTFKEDYKLRSIAKRLREELDGLMEICLDLNNSPSIPPELRWDVRTQQQKEKVTVVPENITPAESTKLLAHYKSLVKAGTMPHLDLHVIRDQVDENLAAQGARNYEELEDHWNQYLYPNRSNTFLKEFEDCVYNYVTTEEEEAFLLKQYAQLKDKWSLDRLAEQKANGEDKDMSDLSGRDLEKHLEMLNPMSQQNWLRANAKIQSAPDENEGLASQDPKPTRKRASKNLAKQVGDRAVERARGGGSPGAGSAFDEDEIGFIDEYPGASGKKRGRDPDTTYRVKGGKSNSSASKAKRKRVSGDDSPSGSTNGSKKAKVDASARAKLE